MKKRLFLILLLVWLISSGNCHSNNIPYRDIAHFSHVFGKEKVYRLYLPDSYPHSKSSFPVIYFFHGWGGRYFKDPSAKPEYEKIGELVNKYQLIMVMWDGSMDEQEPRPYNTGDHKDVKYNVQMKDYFPELVSHIDSTYRTLKNRENRGIIGFSMGGFMGTFLAGKYPDMVSAAVSLTGSPEFFIGHPDNHTLYPVRFTLDNLSDVSFLFHNREECPMAGLNDEVPKAAAWAGIPDFHGSKLPGGHKLDEPGETKVFESVIQFVADRFRNPLPVTKPWSHYDFYPDFRVWGYDVRSNKNEPGFLYLRNVSRSGFGFYSLKWLPGGRPIRNCEATVSTAPLYSPGEMYTISLYKPVSRQMETRNEKADHEGRLTFVLPGDGTEVSIRGREVPVDFTVVGHELGGSGKFLEVSKENLLMLKLMIRGAISGPVKTARITLTCKDPLIKIENPVMEITFGSGEMLNQTQAFRIWSKQKPPFDGSPAMARIQVSIEYGSIKCEDHIDLPVEFDVPLFQQIGVIEDKWAAAGTHLLYEFLQPGIADSVLQPGQQVILTQQGHPLKLYSDDPYIISGEELTHYIVLPAHWPDGFTPVSSVKIADDCPDGHIIECFGHYETKTWLPAFRQVTWGKIRIKIEK